MQRIAAVVSALMLAVVLLLPKGALAACTLPNTLTNGQAADANQVMANFNALVSCINGSVNAGTAGQVGYYSSTGSTISGTSLSSLLDASIGSTRGSLLQRGASGWTSIVPGASGTVLTSQGAGADPIYVASAAGMRGLFSGQMSPVIPSKSASGLSTWLNQGGTTESDDANGMFFTVPSNGSTNIARGLYGPAPTSPYSRTILLLYDELNAGNSYVMFGWYDGTAKLQTTAYSNNSNRGWYDWNSASSLQTIHSFAMPLFEFIWLRLEDDGTNYTMSYSFDGVHYQPITTGTKASGWLGSTGYSNIFVGCDCWGAQGHFTILSYQ